MHVYSCLKTALRVRSLHIVLYNMPEGNTPNRVCAVRMSHWYKIAIQCLLVIFHGISRLSLVFS